MELNFNNECLEFKQKSEVIISRQQRNGRKSWTLIDIEQKNKTVE